MKEIIRCGFVLGFICLVASSLLAGVNTLTKAKILAQAKLGREAALKEVIPQAVRFESVKSGEDIIYYKAYTIDKKLVGVAFKTSDKGYSGNIETMVGMSKDGIITSLKILSQNETPGLGNRILESEFTGQFANKDIQGLDKVEAITGATVSSKAVIDSVKKKAEEIKTLIKNER